MNRSYFGAFLRRAFRCMAQSMQISWAAARAASVECGRYREQYNLRTNRVKLSPTKVTFVTMRFHALLRFLPVMTLL